MFQLRYCNEGSHERRMKEDKLGLSWAKLSTAGAQLSWVVRSLANHKSYVLLRLSRLKKILFLRLVYPIDRFFALIEDPQTKIPTNAYFGHQRPAKLSHRELQIFELPCLVHFWLDCFFLLWRPFLGSINASD